MSNFYSAFSPSFANFVLSSDCYQSVKRPSIWNGAFAFKPFFGLRQETRIRKKPYGDLRCEVTTIKNTHHVTQQPRLRWLRNAHVKIPLAFEIQVWDPVHFSLQPTMNQNTSLPFFLIEPLSLTLQWKAFCQRANCSDDPHMWAEISILSSTNLIHKDQIPQMNNNIHFLEHFVIILSIFRSAVFGMHDKCLQKFHCFHKFKPADSTVLINLGNP